MLFLLLQILFNSIYTLPIKTIKIETANINLVEKHNLETYVSSAIIENINKLGIYQRPVHCTDIKRETLYIKNNDIDIGYIKNKFREYLYIPQMPDPDLLIRTAGEQRLSNFLLYQISYTELMFFDTLWPEFGEEDLNKAVVEFSKRKRTYGKA